MTKVCQEKNPEKSVGKKAFFQLINFKKIEKKYQYID